MRQVQEFYADFYAVNPDLFTLNLGGTLALSRPKALYHPQDEVALKRCTAGLLALLLSFKVRGRASEGELPWQQPQQKYRARQR